MFVLVPKYTQRFEYEYHSFTVFIIDAQKKAILNILTSTDILKVVIDYSKNFKF
jgi:hypothetical protein